MEDIYKYRKNCYNITDAEGEYVREWTNNDTSNTLIEVGMAVLIPHVLFTPLSPDKYQFCGPLLIFAELFAKLSRTRIRLLKFPEWINKIYYAPGGGIDAIPDIVLMVFIPSSYTRLFVYSHLDTIMRITSYFTHTFPDRVLSMTKRGEHLLFKQFETFEWEVYYGIIASIIVISFVISVYKHSLKSFFTTFWSYLSVLLSDTYSLPIKTLIDRQLTGVWLMSCTVLLASFSGQLREMLIKSKPIHWIDSLQDLYKWKDITKIQTLEFTDFPNFIDMYNNTDPMATEFDRRNVQRLLGHPAIYNSNAVIDYQGVINGETVVIFPLHYIQIYKQRLINEGFEEDIDFHVSHSGGYSQPMFSATNKRKINESMANKLDLAFAIIRESGLYEYLFKVSLKPRRLGADQGENVVVHTFDHESTSLDQLRGILLLFLMGEFITILTIIFEITNFFLKGTK